MGTSGSGTVRSRRATGRPRGGPASQETGRAEARFRRASGVYCSSSTMSDLPAGRRANSVCWSRLFLLFKMGNAFPRGPAAVCHCVSLARPGRRALPSAGGSGSQAPFTPAYCPSAQIRVVLFRESGAGGRGQVVGEGCRRRMHGHPGDRSAARPGPPVWRGQGAPATSPRASRSLLSAPSFLFLHDVDLIITFASPGIRPAACLTFVHWLQFLQIQGNIRSTLISQAREFSATGQAVLTPARLHRGWARGPGPEP